MKLGDGVVVLVGTDGKDLTISPTAGQQFVSLVREGGEGGYFSEAELVEVIRQFMSERM